jgi:integrase
MYCEYNPVDDLTSQPKKRHKRNRPSVTEAQLETIVEALDTEDRKIAVWLALTTGMDRRVIMGLCPSQVDTDTKTITFIRPKTNKQITVPINDLLFPLILARLSGKSPLQPLLRGLHHGFRREFDWWHNACAKAGTPGLWFRDLRALAVGRLMRAGGVALSDARDLLGHSSIQTTADHYSTPNQQVAEKLRSLPVPGLRGIQ